MTPLEEVRAAIEHDKTCMNHGHRFKEPRRYIDALELAVKALEKIGNEHQAYSDHEEGQYGIGVTDGHRCARGWADQALADIARVLSGEGK